MESRLLGSPRHPSPGPHTIFCPLSPLRMTQLYLKKRDQCAINLQCTLMPRGSHSVIALKTTCAKDHGLSESTRPENSITGQSTSIQPSHTYSVGCLVSSREECISDRVADGYVKLKEQIVTALSKEVRNLYE